MGWKEHSNPKYKPIKIQHIMHPHGLLKTNKNVIFWYRQGESNPSSENENLVSSPIDDSGIYYCKYRNLYFNYQIYLYKYIDESIYCQGKSTQLSTYIPLFTPFLLRQPHCHNLLTYKSHLFGVWQHPHNLSWRNQDWSKPMGLNNLPHSLPYHHNSYWC